MFVNIQQVATTILTEEIRNNDISQQVVTTILTEEIRNNDISQQVARVSAMDLITMGWFGHVITQTPNRLNMYTSEIELQADTASDELVKYTAFFILIDDHLATIFN
ncbi:hypothetical protein BsWGS_06488 [Bradybaena similaris]